MDENIFPHPFYLHTIPHNDKGKNMFLDILAKGFENENTTKYLI
jgi:hypothetical protein